ncbi:MAG: DNA adenine methylase, partial [Candidatus Obscuribacterales bacterium]|nr:DNA adenine methylase [Candidatus Obscuribacterales bacterium]
RYTKEQFVEEDHRELGAEILRLHELGCFVILTNSNHPIVHELYSHFNLEIISSRRSINSIASGRTGEDVIVTIPPRRRLILSVAPESLPKQVEKYPSTRFMGSKEKLLSQIWDVSKHFDFETVLDLFSGSGVVGYMYKSHGKTVIANDYMAMSATFSKALIENNSIRLSPNEIERLFKRDKKADKFVSETFSQLYFPAADCKLIDAVRANIAKIRDTRKRALAMSALIRACIKKRPRGIFTYVGERYDDGRQDLRLSLEEQIRRAADIVNEAVFDNGRNNLSKRCDAMKLRCSADLIYIDPPYYSPLSDNEYVRRYHFVEGLACDWEGVEMQWHTKTKKFKSYPTPFSSRVGAAAAFDALFHKYKDSVLVVSYSSNSLPTKDEMLTIMSRHKHRVDAIEIDYRYSFGTQRHKVGNNKNSVQEFLFIGY